MVRSPRYSSASSSNNVSLPLVSDVEKSMREFAFVTTINLVAIVFMLIAVAVRPNADQTASVQKIGQDIYNFFSSDVVAYIVKLAPFLVFLSTRGAIPSYYWIIFALINYGLSYVFKITDGATWHVSRDEIGKYIGNWTRSAGPIEKTTDSRLSVSEILRTSSFSCFAVAVLQVVMESGRITKYF